MKYKATDHTFAICAHGESPYLEACINSLLRQSVSSTIIICTSTPNNHIRKVASHYGLKLFVNHRSTGIASDWNYAIKCTDTPLVTIAHQDDIYEPVFLKATLRSLNSGSNAIIAFTSYYEIHNGSKITSKDFINLKIKDLMLKPLSLSGLQKNIGLRRFILSLADPICCPSVTYVKKNIPGNLFSNKYKAVLDWAAWERLSSLDGRFVYIDHCLVGHRMYASSTTMKMIRTNSRTKEDLMIYQLFWPTPIARAIDRLYSLSQKTRKKNYEKHNNP